MNEKLVLNFSPQTSTIDDISEHVRNYGSMDIREMLYIDKILKKVTNKEYDLLLLLNKLIDSSDDVNGSVLKRIRNNFELYKDIVG